MGKLETLMFKLSIPMPRARIRLPERLGDTACLLDADKETFAMALGSLAGKGFTGPQKALSWAKRKKLLPPEQQAQLTWCGAVYMLFAFARASRVNIALPSCVRLFDVADASALPRWSLTAVQWCLSADLSANVDFTREITTQELSELFARYVAALQQARKEPERVYKIQLFGDSITDCSWGDCTTWVNFFPQRLGAAGLNLVNNAYGGGALTAVPRKKNCVVRLVPQMLHPDDDLVVVFALTNDFAGDAFGPGTPEDTDPKTIWGAVKEISRAVGQLPMFFIGSAPRCNQADRLRARNDRGEMVNSLGWTMPQGDQALRDGAAACGRGYLDMYDDPIFRHEELAYATIDGLHPNALGDILIAARIYDKLREYLQG